MKLQKYSVVLVIMLLVACGGKSKSLELSAEEILRITTLQNPFDDKPVKLQAAPNLPPVFIGVDNCKVYRSTSKSGVVIKWSVIIKPDFYPWFTSCTKTDVEIKAEYLYILLAETAVGAGGGSVGVGRFRSKDGYRWERQVKETWQKIETL